MIQALNSITTQSHRELLTAWTIRTIRARYQQSMLGVLWAIAQPAASVAIFTVLFTKLMPVDTDGVPYVLFSFTALVPWTFFAASLTDIVNAVVENMNLVTKIYFPREILPVAALLARFVDFVIAAFILVALMIAFQAPFFPTGWLFLPVIIGVQISLTLGLGLVGAALNVFIRDIKHLLELVLRLLLYVSPVIYPASQVPESLRPLYFLNPMAGIITAYRDVLLYESLPGYYLLTAGLISLISLVAGYLFFKAVEFKFADVV